MHLSYLDVVHSPVKVVFINSFSDKDELTQRLFTSKIRYEELEEHECNMYAQISDHIHGFESAQLELLQVQNNDTHLELFIAYRPIESHTSHGYYVYVIGNFLLLSCVRRL